MIFKGIYKNKIVIHYICSMENIFTIRNTESSDYAMLCSWWKYFRFASPSLDILPNNGNDGVMVYCNGIEVCAGFLYATSSTSLFWCEWIVSNPEVKDRQVRKESLNLLIKSICDLAKQMGAKVIYTSLKNESLINAYKDNGFQVGSTSTIEMIKVL